MELLDKITLEAYGQCYPNRVLDVFRAHNGWAWKDKHLRRSEEFERRVKNENGKITVHDSKGKIIDLFAKSEKPEQKTEEAPKKESPKPKSLDKS